MSRRRNALLATALAYASLGAPVVPAFPLVRRRRSRHRLSGRGWACGCSDSTCTQPGAHPLSRDAVPLVTRADVTAAWETAHPPPAVMVVPAGVFDIWQVPCVLGAAAMRQMEHQRLRVWPPVSKAPDRRWLMVTAPVDGRRWHVDWPGLGVHRVDRDSPVLVPPSRTPRGVMHWIWSRRFPRAPLPAADIVLGALAVTAGQLSLAERSDESRAPEAERTDLGPP